MLDEPVSKSAQISDGRGRWRGLLSQVDEGDPNKRVVAAQFLVALATIGSVLAIGTVHLVVLLGVAVLALAATVLMLWSLDDARHRVMLSAPVVVLLALATYTLVQALPMPIGLLVTVAPHNADVWQRCLVPFGERGPAWASISLDPGASTVEGLKWLVYASVFSTASAIAARRGAAWGVTLVFISGLAAAFATVGHGLAGATHVFGLYEPKFAAAPWHVGPLLNPNNLAGYLNLTAVCGLGLMLMRKPVAPPWLLGLGVATIIGVDVTSASRGGLIALPLGILILAAILWRQGERASVPRRALLWLLATSVSGGALLALLGATSSTWNEAYDKSLAKMSMVNWAKPMVMDHRWLGIGRGSFQSVFPAYRTEPGNVTYEYAESFPVQWIAEWGIPIGLCALLALAWLFRPRNLGVQRSVVAAAVWAGVVILVIQNLADLAFEVPGVMIAVSLALGSVWGDARRRRQHSSNREGDDRMSETRHRMFAPFAALVGVAAILLSAKFGWRDVAHERSLIHETYAKGNGAKDAPGRAELRADLRSAMLRHPAEPYFSLMGALVAWVGSDASPMPWVQHALERAPQNGRIHLLLSDVLIARKAKSQALMEVRMAVEYDEGLVSAGAQKVTRWTQSYDDLLTTVPPGARGASMLEVLASALNEGKYREVRIRLQNEALKRDPTRPRVHEAMGFELLGELARTDSAGPCADAKRAACIASVEEHARALDSAAHDTSSAARMRARVMTLAGDADGAEQLLANRCSSVTDRADCLYARLDAAVTAKPPKHVSAAVNEYLAARCASASECAQAATVVGNLLASRGEWGTALTYWSRAAREEPTEERWLKVGDAAAQVGAHAQAADALEKVARMRGSADSELQQRIEAERSAAVRAATP